MTDKERLKQMTAQIKDSTPTKQEDLREVRPTVQDEAYYLAIAEDYYSMVVSDA